MPLMVPSYSFFMITKRKERAKGGRIIVVWSLAGEGREDGVKKSLLFHLYSLARVIASHEPMWIFVSF